MFFPVVAMFVATNLTTTMIVFLVLAIGKTYRELYMVAYLSTAVNAVVNLPIYYYRSSTFKKATDETLMEFRKSLGMNYTMEEKNAGQSRKSTSYSEKETTDVTRTSIRFDAESVI